MPSTTINDSAGGMQLLKTLMSTEPPQWLAPNPELSKSARLSSEYLFSCLQPHAIKCPFDKLLTDGFDSEQIWQQIDVQTQLSTLRRHLNKFERHPEEISKMKPAVQAEDDEKIPEEEEQRKLFGQAEEMSDDDDLDGDDLDGDDDDMDGGESESEEEKTVGVEDKFLKLNELEKFMKDDEAREYGTKSNKKRSSKKYDDEDEDEDDEDDENLQELVGFEDGSEDENARYEDFFAPAENKGPGRKSKFVRDFSSSEEEYEEEEQSEKEKEKSENDGEDDEEDEQSDDDNAPQDKKKSEGMSAHEKQQAKIQAQIKELEKANMDPKSWTMQGEVTASKRPKNSALEVDLDFEHNARPAPVITQEVTASLESMIRQRIIEGRFDDVQRSTNTASKAPRELKELDENKSKKGLAEVYEDEFVKKSDPVNAPPSFSDELEKEGDLLWKKISLKLDALSHFHFAPKPVIEDMTIQANVPALAMEEIAPVGVSDAAMLAPEEVFTGKGNFKEEGELTKEDRKRRRANKKRKFKNVAAKLNVKKPQDNSLAKDNDAASKEVA